jgi:hypothetical protein
MYETIDKFVPDLEKLGWRWAVAVVCPLFATIELPWKGWPQLIPGACLCIALLLTILGFLRMWLVEPLRREPFEIHPDDLELPIGPPL